MQEISVLRRSIVPPASLSSLDLRDIGAKEGGEACRLELVNQTQPVEVLVIGGRAGVAWGSDATWIDLRKGESAEDAARIVLTDAEETERRR